MPSRNKIFVSYSHKDGKLFEEFKTMLAPAIQRGLVDLWDDQKIPPGAKWKEEIQNALASARIAVLLVSQNFLASHFIAEKELPPLLRAAREEGVTVFWIYLSSCLFEQTEIASYQAAHDISRPLDRLPKSQRQAVLSETCAKLIQAAASAAEPPESTSMSDVCPYRGLLSFTGAESEFFFGREELIGELVDQLRRHPRLLAVIGSSGSGKSSVIQAGLMPRLNSVPGFSKSEVIYFRPGATPLDSLRRALLSANVPFGQNIELVEIVRRIIEALGGSRLVLFADQFEEVFALCSESERVQLMKCLFVVLDSALPLTLLLTLRADFYDQLLRSQMGPYLKLAQVIALPMAGRELEAAIKKPAEMVGLQFEPGLAERIFQECSDIEQPLPLLEFALTQLWEKRQRGYLTHAAYEAIGRVAGALGAWATDAYQSLAPRERELTRRIFTSLVHFGKSGAADTRRKLSLKQLVTNLNEPQSVIQIVMYMASRRLLLTDRDASSEEPYVEIVHDALLSEWEQLQSWIREDHPFLSWRQWLQERMQEWNDKQQDSGGLLRGGLLAEAREKEATRAADLSQAEREYIEASHQLELQDQHRLEQLNTEAQLQREEARRRTEESIHQRQISLAHQLASYSEEIRTQHPELVERSVLLAVESLKRHRTLEGDQALRLGMSLLPRAVTRVVHKDEVRSLTFSPNGQWLATASNDGTARVTEVMAGEEVARIVHEGEVTSVSFSADSALLASASMDCTVRVLEMATRQQKMQVSHDLQIYSVEFSPDGLLLLTSSMDQTARLWRVEDGAELACFKHEDQVVTAKFSPHGDLVATASWDSSARIWKTDTGTEIAEFMHEDRIQAVAFSPSGDFLVTGSMDRTARVWRVADGQEVERMSHSGEVADIDISPDGKLLATASWDHTARIWDIDTGRELTRITHDGNIYVVSFSPDGKFVATAGIDYTVRLFDTKTGGEISRMVHEGRVFEIAFAPDSTMLASGSSDCSARVWQSMRGSETPWMIHEDGVYDIRFSPDGKFVATGSMDTTARMWDAATGRELRKLPHDAGVNGLEFSPDGKLVATASMDCALRIWDAETGVQLARMDHDFQVYSVTFSQDARFIGSSSMDRTARIWSVATGKEQTRVRHNDQVNTIKFSPAGDVFVTASMDGTARVWDINGGDELARFCHDDAVQLAIFSRNGLFVATGAADRSARMWDAQTGKEAARFQHEDRVCSIALSPSEEELATASWDRTVRLWDIRSGKELVRLTHDHQVCAVAFDPNGDFLATASWDRTARIWELRTGREIARLGHDERIHAVVFSPDGRLVATASMDCTAQLRLWQTEDLIAQASTRLTRNLTYDEWQQYLNGETYRKTCPALP